MIKATSITYLPGLIHREQ